MGIYRAYLKRVQTYSCDAELVALMSENKTGPASLVGKPKTWLACLSLLRHPPVKIQYFPDTDTLYIDIANRPSTESEVIGEELSLDLDTEGKLVGITIEHYSQTADTVTVK